MSEAVVTSAREVILNSVRNALPEPAVSLPPSLIPENTPPVRGGVGYRGHLMSLEAVEGFPEAGEPLTPYFQKQLRAMGGQSFLVSGLEEARSKNSCPVY